MNQNQPDVSTNALDSRRDAEQHNPIIARTATNSLHIVHVLDHSIPLHSGYAFRTRAILDAQRALGWKTSHLTSSKHKLSAKAEERIDGLYFYRTPMVPPWLDRTPLVNQFAVVEYLARRLVRVCETEQPDIIHAHSPCLTGIAALKVGSRLGLPVVYEMRAPWEDAATHHGTAKEGSFRYKASRAPRAGHPRAPL